MTSASPRGRRVVLWRHGQTSWNLERRFQGTTDIELTEDGVGQARRAARLLASLRPDAIVASDLRRAAATAAELTALTGLEATYDEGLRETYAGEWQGLTHEEIIARYGDQYAAWKRGESVRRGGGELETEVADRAAPVVLRHADKLPDDGLLVVVSHGGTIRTTIGRIARPGVPPLGGTRRPVELLLVRPRRGRPRLASAGAQRGHAAGTGPRRRRLGTSAGCPSACQDRPLGPQGPDFTFRQVAG